MPSTSNENAHGHPDTIGAALRRAIAVGIARYVPHAVGVVTNGMAAATVMLTSATASFIAAKLVGTTTSTAGLFGCGTAVAAVVLRIAARRKP